MSASPEPTRTVPQLLFAAAKSAIYALFVSAIVIPHFMIGRVLPGLSDEESVVLQYAFSAILIIVILMIMSYSAKKKMNINSDNKISRSHFSSRILTNYLPFLIGFGVIYLSSSFIFDLVGLFLLYILVATMFNHTIDNFLVGRIFFRDPHPDDGRSA